MSSPDPGAGVKGRAAGAGRAAGTGRGDGDGQADALEWLFALQRFGMEPGLERTRALLDAVGSPQRSLAVVLVAGTNGKGSVTAVLAACLRAAGRRTGSFFSPHLQRVGERARVDGREASREQMRAAVAAVRPHAEGLGATFFEVVTVAALLRFQAAGAEWAVMEVGLGGRLDATNALEPRLSVITGVGLDHQAVLGPDLVSIAGEKAGVLRPGVPALTGASGAPLAVIAERAAGLGAPLAALGRDVAVRLERSSWEGIEVALEPLVASDPGWRELLASLPLRLSSPLVGPHQADNVALAALAALRLGVDAAAVRAGVARTRWPGRLEVLELAGRRFVLDGAHNPQAAEALARALASLGAEVSALVLGLSADKDVAGVVSPLAPLADTVIATRAALSPRSLDAGELKAAVSATRDRDRGSGGGSRPREVIVADDPEAALTAALQVASLGATVVVAGSLFLVGEFRTLLTGAEAEPGQRWQ